MHVFTFVLEAKNTGTSKYVPAPISPCAEGKKRSEAPNVSVHMQMQTYTRRERITENDTREGTRLEID